MKTAIKILSYSLAIILGIGLLSLAAENDLDFYTLLTCLIVEAQCILVLIYIEKK